jgi:hypothetical protein
MNKPLPTFALQACRRPSPLSLPNVLLAIALALPCAPLLAAATADGVGTPTISASQSEVSWTSGGVSEEGREELRRVASRYNVHVMFSEQRGSYLAGIPFTVVRLASGKEQQIVSAVSEGPLLYLKLAPGGYRIAAEVDGVWQKQHVRVGAGGSPARMSFVFRSK